MPLFVCIVSFVQPCLLFLPDYVQHAARVPYNTNQKQTKEDEWEQVLPPLLKTVREIPSCGGSPE